MKELEEKKKLEKRAKEAQREYQRKWRKDNPDKIRKYNQRYWEKRALAQEG